jgi:hypothetical protein
MVYTSLLADPAMWLCSVLTVVVALIPDILLQVTTAPPPALAVTPDK